tara:strand:- start:104 stop:283 length:180 start_codon:yes stop_codon:yes gene_type:complete
MDNIPIVKVGFIIAQSTYDEMKKICELKNMQENSFVELAIDDLCFLHRKTMEQDDETST